MFKIFLPVFLSFLYSLEGRILIGGGSSTGTPYLAIVDDITSVSLELSQFGQTGSSSVRGRLSMNDDNIASFGVTRSSVFFLRPDNSLQEISNVPANAAILSTGINNNLNGVATGLVIAGPPFVLTISPSGVATQVSGAAAPIPFGAITSGAINESGLALVAGSNDSSRMYAAYIDPNAQGMQLILPDPGALQGCDINASGNGIIGGRQSVANTAYCALVTPDGSVAQVSGIPVLTGSVIQSVAINDAGQAIIGGNNGTSTYAALVSSSGEVSPIFGSGTPQGEGVMNGVDINAFGYSVIGGRDNDVMYAAFVSPSGETTKISGELILFEPGEIQAVAISDYNIAVIGGDTDTQQYAAIISPTGVATRITGGTLFAGPGVVETVALSPDSLIPSSFGSLLSPASSLLLLSSQVLPSHFNIQKFQTVPSFQNKVLKEQALLVDNSMQIQKVSSSNTSNYSIWGTAFGDFFEQKKRMSSPKVDGWMTGVLGGFDYTGISNCTLGCSASYVFNHNTQEDNKASSNQGFLSLYFSWFQKYFYLNSALWGGYSSTKNERYSIGTIVSDSKFGNWLFSPHLEFSFPFVNQKQTFLIDPFCMFDWASSWQEKITEEGAAGFNLIIPSKYTSILRSEVGLHLAQACYVHWGMLLFEEKGSWVNKHPFSAGNVLATFIGSPSSFSLEVFDDKAQNLGAAEFIVGAYPDKVNRPYGALKYQLEINSYFQNHLISLELGGRF